MVKLRPCSGDVDLGLKIPSQPVGFLVGSAVLVFIGVALILLAPAKLSSQGATFPDRESSLDPEAACAGLGAKKNCQPLQFPLQLKGYLRKLLRARSSAVRAVDS